MENKQVFNNFVTLGDLSGVIQVMREVLVNYDILTVRDPR